MITSPGGGLEYEKLKKGAGIMEQVQVFLKGGELALFGFNFFNVYHFSFGNYFSLGKTVRCLKKKVFFCHNSFDEKRSF